LLHLLWFSDKIIWYGVFVSGNLGEDCVISLMMASPMLESFCCMRFGDNDSCSNHSYPQPYEYHSVNISYNVLCIISSVMSICGAVYQLTPRLPRRPPRGRTELESLLRQNVIICFLAIADLLASFGLHYCVLMNFS